MPSSTCITLSPLGLNSQNSITFESNYMPAFYVRASSLPLPPPKTPARQLQHVAAASSPPLPAAQHTVAAAAPPPSPSLLLHTRPRSPTHPLPQAAYSDMISEYGDRTYAATYWDYGSYYIAFIADYALGGIKFYDNFMAFDEFYFSNFYSEGVCSRSPARPPACPPARPPSFEPAPTPPIPFPCPPSPPTPPDPRPHSRPLLPLQQHVRRRHVLH